MAKNPPWHSACVSDRNVYHDNDKCPEGNQIAIHDHRLGTDGRPKYEQCSKLV
jgi:hypothetical protein